MAGISDEKRAWVKSMLGVEIPEPGEHEEPEAEGHDSDPLVRAKGRGSKSSKSSKSGKALPPDFAQKFQSAKSAWTSAIGEVDGQISELQKQMAKSPDEEIRDIAQHALAGVTGGYKSLLGAYMKALGDGTDEGAVRKEGVGLLGALSDFRTTIEKDRQIAVMDDNPFNTVVSIRGTLGPVLNELEAALRHGLA